MGSGAYEETHYVLYLTLRIGYGLRQSSESDAFYVPINIVEQTAGDFVQLCLNS